MKVELKNIKYAAFNSQETNCYQATVYLDGVKSILASNEGQGGGDSYHDLVPGATKRLEEYCRTLPDVHGFGMTLKMDAELLLGEILEDYLLERDMTRALKRKLHFTKVGTPGIFTVSVKFTPEYAAKLRQKNPKVDKILNELPPAEALELWKGLEPDGREPAKK